MVMVWWVNIVATITWIRKYPVCLCRTNTTCSTEKDPGNDGMLQLFRQYRI